jgi:hypothetical protein
LIVAAAAPFTASVADPVFTALKSIEIESPAAGVNVGEVEQLYALPLFVVVQVRGADSLCAVAAVGCPLAFVPSTLAEAGTAPPLILATVVAPCVPATSPARLPVKFVAVVAVFAVVAVVAVVALVALATAVEPIALTICAAVAATGCPLAFVPSTLAEAGPEGVPEICEYATCAHVGPPLVSPVSYWPVEQELVPAFAVRLESNTPLSCSWPEVPV